MINYSLNQFDFAGNWFLTTRLKETDGDTTVELYGEGYDGDEQSFLYDTESLNFTTAHKNALRYLGVIFRSVLYDLERATLSALYNLVTEVHSKDNKDNRTLGHIYENNIILTLGYNSDNEIFKIIHKLPKTYESMTKDEMLIECGKAIDGAIKIVNHWQEAFKLNKKVGT